MKEAPLFERTGVSAILFALLDSGEMINKDLLEAADVGGNTYYDRRDELKDAGLITVKRKATKKKDGVIMTRGGVYIKLTPTGEKVARKLHEIEEIMEGNDE